MMTAPELLKELVYKTREKQANCDHMVNMPAGFGKWEYVPANTVFGDICPHCNKDTRKV